MDVETKLKAWDKKTIHLSELREMLHTDSEAELFALVSDAVKKGAISPVKAAGKNGNLIYPLFLKYRISTRSDESEALRAIALLHPAITQSGYLQSKPEQYLKYRIQLEQLSKFLFRKQVGVAVSKKERAFEIFNEEKQLEDRSFCHLLRRLGLTSATLCYYETPEYCFNDYIPTRKSRMTLLICENKDIWFNIRRRMYEDGAREIFGVPIDGVVYGCGNKVSEAGALSAYTRFMESAHVRYLYWGDIDRAGLNIYLSLQRNNQSLDIDFFTEAYEKMLALIGHRILPDSADHRERMDNYEPLYARFADADGAQIRSIIIANKRVPQEIINYDCLLSCMR